MRDDGPLPPSETYRTLNDDKGAPYLILSADDAPVELGDHTDLGGDLRQHPRFSVFAESVAIAGAVRCASLVLATHALDVVAASGAVLDASGDPGTSSAGVTAVSGDGANGGDGKPGGTLRTYVEQLDAGGLALGYRARGGDGGNGQTTLEGKGGTGGNGREGGDVAVWFSDVDQVAFMGVRACFTTDDLVVRRSRARDVLTRLKASPALSAALADQVTTLSGLLAGSAPDDPTALGSILETIGLALDARRSTTRTEVKQQIDVGGGAYGAHGDGGTGSKGGPGDNGSSGRPGSADVTVLDIAGGQTPPTDSIVVHPDQCDMVLGRARIAYFLGTDAMIGTAILLAQRLLDRTGFVEGLADDAPVRALYAEHGGQVGILDGIARLQATRTAAAGMLQHILLGQDYFGHAETDVPVVAESQYQRVLDQQLTDLDAIEASYTAYQAALGEQQAVLASVRSARDQAGQAIDEARKDLTTLAGMANLSANTIVTFVPVLAARKQALTDELAKVVDDIKSAFNFNFNDLIGALTTTAFAPNGFMFGLQGASLLYKGVTTVSNDQGVDVDKDFIINGIKTVEADAGSLIEGWQTRDDGTLAADDPRATKLIADRDKLLKQLDQISGQLDGALAAVKTKFDDYISAVLARNTEILRYNAIINAERQRVAGIAREQARLDALGDKALATMRTDLPALATFMAGTYHAARERVLTTLSNASRAYRFWALTADDPLQDAIGDTPPTQLTAAFLRDRRSGLLDALGRGLEKLKGAPQVFPPADARGASGVFIELEPEWVDSLRSGGKVTFKIPTVMPRTKADDSPLSGWANVRLFKVRVWLDGAATADDTFFVRITHEGAEDIVAADGAVYHFTHSPITIGFKYRRPAAGPVAVIEDADIARPDSDTFAPVGPFAWWTIEIPRTSNRSLDLTTLTAARLELFGSNYVF